MTRTLDPARAVSVPTGRMARPLAFVTVASRFDAEGPVLPARHAPFSRHTRTRANCVLSFGPLMSLSRMAQISGRKMSLRPIILRRAGRMKTSKETNTETGLPGRPKYGVPSTEPNACGIPGCMATR